MTTLDERIEAARKLEGYTPGPWKLHVAESFDGRSTFHYHEVWTDDLDVIAEEVYRAHNDGRRDSMRLIAAAPDLHRLALDLAAERERLRGLLWYAWHEFNAIRARSGAPLTHDGMTTVAEEWWDQMTEAFEAAIGEDAAKPWPSPEARVALASEPRA